MNTFNASIMAMTAAIAMTASAAQAETVLKMGSVVPTGSPFGVWVTGVAEQIEQESGGALKIDLLLDGQAGDEQTVLRQTTRGRLDLAFVSNFPLSILSEEMALPSTPYLFDSTEQGSCVAHQHMAGIFGDMMARAGVVPLGWTEAGQLIIFAKKPVHTPADMAGLKLRVGPAKSEAEFASAIGATGVPMGTTDAVPGLQAGVVDAATFVTVYGIAIGTHKAAPNVTVTNHGRLIGGLMVSQRTWDGLSDQEKEWLGLFGKAAPALTETILSAETAMLDKIAAEGTVVYRPTDAEMAQWRDATRAIGATLVNDIGGQAQDVMEALEAAKAACGA